MIGRAISTGVCWRAATRFQGPTAAHASTKPRLSPPVSRYREIDSAADCPPCFSRPLAAILIRLNDSMNDEERNQLKPFVVRLAGSADADAVERSRSAFMALEAYRRLTPIAFAAGVAKQSETGWLGRRAPLMDRLDPALRTLLADSCDATTAKDAVARLKALRKTIDEGRSGLPTTVGRTLSNIAKNCLTMLNATVSEKGENGVLAALEVSFFMEDVDVLAPDEAVWSVAVDIVDQAFAIGAQAQVDDIGAVSARLEAAKGRAREERGVAAADA